MLRFSPYAWAKLRFFCHYGNTEIGGFGITPANDPLLIEDFVTVRQRVSSVTVAFDDEAVAELFESQVDAGRKPEQFLRIWLHTHPGNSSTPSLTDEETFQRVFGPCHWAVLFILARGGETYARLRFNVGPGGQLLIPVTVDFQTPFLGSNNEVWLKEYRAHVHPEEIDFAPTQASTPATASDDDWFGKNWDDVDPAWFLDVEDEELAVTELDELDTLEDPRANNPREMPGGIPGAGAGPGEGEVDHV